MCLAIPGRIRNLEEDRHFATVEVANVRRRVNVDLLQEDGLEVGDWVLIHVGFAMSKISAQQAEEQIRLLSMLGEEQAAMEEWRGYNSEDRPGGGPEGSGGAHSGGEQSPGDAARGDAARQSAERTSQVDTEGASRRTDGGLDPRDPSSGEHHRKRTTR